VDGAAAEERVGGLTEVRPFRDAGFAGAEALAGAGRASCLPTTGSMGHSASGDKLLCNFYFSEQHTWQSKA